MAISKRVMTLLQIRPDEAHMALLVAGLFALIELGRSIGGSATDALFFLRFGVDNLPYMYIGLGVLNFVAALSYAAFLGRLNKGRFFSTLFFLFAVALLIERAALLLDLRALYPVMWLSVNIIGALLGTLAWNTAGEVCDTRQAKRLFPLFVSAGILGGLLGSLVIGPAAKILGTENLFVVDAVLLLIGLLVVRHIAQGYFRVATGKRQESTFIQDVRAGSDVVRRSPMLQLLAVSAVLFSVLYFSISFPFGKAVSAAFSNEADLAGFLGFFTGVASAITFVVSLVVANRLYARIGVVNSLLLLPITYLAGFVLFAVNFTLASAVIVRMSQLVILSGIGDGAYSTFFNIVPAEKRAQVRAFDAGVPSQIGTILSGVLLILGERALTTTQIFIMGMVVALLCTITIWQIRKRYTDALIEALRAGRFEVFTAGSHAFAGVQGDASAIGVAVGALRDAKPSIRRLAAEMLPRMGAIIAVPALLGSLSDPDAETRSAVVQALGDLKAQEALDPIAALLADPDPVVRAAAAQTLPVLQPSLPVHLFRSLRDLLSDPDFRVRAQAAASLIQTGQAEVTLDVLDSLLSDADPAHRALAVEAIGSAVGRVADALPAVITDRLIQSLDDSSPIMRRAACRACADLRDTAALDSLAGRLSDPDSAVRVAAAHALRRSEALPTLLRVLDTGLPAAQTAALDALIAHVGQSDLSVPLRRYARREIAGVLELRGLISAIPATGRVTGLLCAALSDRAAQGEQRLVKVIGLLGHAEAMELVGKSLQVHDAEARAAAIEALDMLGDKTLVREIIPLLESEGSASHRPPLPLVEALSRLFSPGDPWLRPLAIRAAGEIGLPEMQPVLRTILSDPEPLAVEAAYESLLELGEPMETLQTVSLMERILLLRDVPLFAELSPEDLKQIADVARERWLADGTIVCREGDEGSEMYVLVSGQMRVTKLVDNQQKLLATRSAGDFIGEMAIIEAAPRFATLTAQGDVRVLVIDDHRFKTILRDRPEVSLAVLRGLSRRLRERT